MKDKSSPACVPQCAAGDRTPQPGTNRAHPYKNPSSGHGLVPTCQRRRGSGLGFRLPTAPAVPPQRCQRLCQPGVFLPRSCTKKWESAGNSNHMAQSSCSARRSVAPRCWGFAAGQHRHRLTRLLQIHNRYNLSICGWRVEPEAMRGSEQGRK